MQRIHFFDPPQRFICGTVGQPGERAFFLQMRDSLKLITVAIEKSQVQAVVDRLHLLIRQVQGEQRRNSLLEFVRDVEPLETPIEPQFQVGVIGISYEEESDLIQLDFQEAPQGDEDSPVEDLEFVDSSELEIVRVRISVGHAKAFIRRAESVIAAGRPPCPFCGGPIDPRGHLCPRANGYRR